jgi:hypothetical protein
VGSVLAREALFRSLVVFQSAGEVVLLVSSEATENPRRLVGLSCFDLVGFLRVVKEQ